MRDVRWDGEGFKISLCVQEGPLSNQDLHLWFAAAFLQGPVN